VLGDREGLGAASDAEFPVDVPQMRVDGRRSNAEPLRDRGRGPTSGELVDDLPFPRRQRLEDRFRGTPRRVYTAEVTYQKCEEPWRDDGFASMERANGGG